MRNFIIAVALLVAPLATWIAGCRDNGARAEARFPQGPEVKRLARAEPASGRGAPEIPNPIDPDVLLAPYHPTFARIRMVMDREERLASRQESAPGLFVLPRQDHYELAETRPAPQGRHEFASRPPAPTAALFHGENVPAAAYQDISAMAPPAVSGVPDDFGMPERSFRPDPPEPALLPEYIPGVFMGMEAEMATPPFEKPLSLAPPGREEPPPTERPELPPRLSSASFDTVALDDLIRVLREPEPLRKDAQGSQASPSPAPREPAALDQKLTALLENATLALALEPLLNLSEPSAPEPEPETVAGKPEAPESREDREKVLSPPAPVGRLAVLDHPYGQDEIATPREKSGNPANRRFLRDFWEYPAADRFSSAAPAGMNRRESAEKSRKAGGEFEDFPSLEKDLAWLAFDDSVSSALEPPQPIAKDSPGGAWKPLPAAPPPAAAEKPRRVSLTPIRKNLGRGLVPPGFDRIDSSVEAPPLVF